MASQFKLAEKLLILKERGAAVLVQISYIRRVWADPKSRPPFFSEKSMETAIKYINRKFPSIDFRSGSQHLSGIQKQKSVVLEGLHNFYESFIDVLEFRDHAYELLNAIDASQCFFNITMNFDLTSSYLDLIVTYASVIYLLSRVEDKKSVVGMYNCAYELSNGNSDPAYPRLGQMFLEYENPWKKLAEEFGPHTKSVTEALLSLLLVYPRRNLTAEQWRGAQLLSLLATPATMLSPACCDTMACEYLSMEVMERWILIGFLLCHTSLNTNPDSLRLWKMALRNGLYISIVRDEVLNIHKVSEDVMDGMKGYGKRIADIRECKELVITQCGSQRREKRIFLRSALKELNKVLEDEPALLGPKALYVFMALSFSRDEVMWLVRHADNVPKTKNPEDFCDPQMAELLFYMEKLRELMAGQMKVVQRYHLLYLSQYDALVLNDIIQGMHVCPEEESVLMSSFVSTLSALNLKLLDGRSELNLKPFRLDWLRLQAYCSPAKAALTLKEYPDLARIMNMTQFHSRMLDSVDELLRETSDLSELCLQGRVFEKMFSQSCEDTSMQRFLISFPLVCSHLRLTETHLLCPEEVQEQEKQCLSVCVGFLEEIARLTCSVVMEICAEQWQLNEKLLPRHSAESISARNKRLQKKQVQKKVLVPKEKPGAESLRKDRVLVTNMDKLHQSLSEFCGSFSSVSELTVVQHIVVPTEFLLSQLELQLNKVLVEMVGYNPGSDVCRPCDVLATVQSYVSTLHSLNCYMCVDMTRLVKSVLLQQMQPLDSHGAQTITTLYTNWYLESLLRQASSSLILHCPTPQCFLSQVLENQPGALAEQYSDVCGLRSLGQLLGPYGLKFLSENLMWHVVSQVGELKKLVRDNMDVLVQMRTNFEDSAMMSELTKKLTGSENVLKRMTIIGVILSFRKMVQEALEEVMERRCPFLLRLIRSLKDFIQPDTDTKVTLGVYELASAAGLLCEIDPVLVSAVVNMQTDASSMEEESKFSCLLLVFVAVSLPVLCLDPNSTFNCQRGGHQNNIHCLSTAVNQLAAAMFTVQRKNIQTHLQEFLKVASSVLLQLGQNVDGTEKKNKESIYLILHMVVDQSPFLTQDMLEKCFPYVLLRNSYREVHKTFNHLS